MRYSFQRLLFRPSGYRNRETGALNNVGTEGDCWSSSSNVSGSNDAARLYFAAGGVNPLNSWYRATAWSVRCVQHLPERRSLPRPTPNLSGRPESGVAKATVFASEIVDSAIRCPAKNGVL